jgi:hypothetical protein
MNFKDFKIGQHVQMWDEEDNKVAKGEVVEIVHHKGIVGIKWDDIKEPTNHEATEFPLISLITR